MIVSLAKENFASERKIKKNKILLTFIIQHLSFVNN